MNEKQRFRIPAVFVRSWFELTADEQKAALIVLVIFLLGLGVRFWHVHKKMEVSHLPEEVVQCVK
jgi:hypothetical protein